MFKKDENTIYFYDLKGKYACFSNFSLHSFKIENKIWPTSEHYFQAKKWAGTPYEEKIRLAKSPGLCKQIAWTIKDPKYPFNKNWDNIRDEMMYRAIKGKFSQNEDCKKVLLGTGNKRIAEDAPKDFYWGIGENGKGKNKLGLILERVRKEISEERNKDKEKK